jgi:hypothetical protein
MNQLFKAIYILSVIFIGLLLYYVVKNFWSNSADRRKGRLLFGKIYEDEKIYFRGQIKILLADLARGQVRWLLVYSRLYPEQRIQITYSTLSREVNLMQYCRALNDREQEHLRYLGMNTYHKEREQVILSATHNSKIITDLVYFLLENIYNQHKAHNLKINRSGE